MTHVRGRTSYRIPRVFRVIDLSRTAVLRGEFEIIAPLVNNSYRQVIDAKKKKTKKKTKHPSTGDVDLSEIMKPSYYTSSIV